MSFDKEAEILIWLSDLKISLNKSNPPTINNIDTKTTICIRVFCNFGYFKEKKQHIKIGVPTMLGMYDVNELLPTIIEIIMPHKIKKRLIIIPKNSIERLKNLNSTTALLSFSIYHSHFIYIDVIFLKKNQDIINYDLNLIGDP